jgi:hypothetical protein
VGDGCIALLTGDAVDVDGSLVVALGGPPADRLLSGESRADAQLWIRVWALRGLLWAWDDRATAALGGALTDPSWRMREMACKVARRHLVGEHVALLAVLNDDPAARVRAVAQDALLRITSWRA